MSDLLDLEGFYGQEKAKQGRYIGTVKVPGFVPALTPLIGGQNEARLTIQVHSIPLSPF